MFIKLPTKDLIFNSNDIIKIYINHRYDVIIETRNDSSYRFPHETREEAREFLDLFYVELQKAREG